MNGPSSRFFSRKDCPANALDDERIAVLGYGNLGRSFALNLRDAGVRDQQFRRTFEDNLDSHLANPVPPFQRNSTFAVEKEASSFIMGERFPLRIH
jgi:hypothetical protein